MRSERADLYIRRESLVTAMDTIKEGIFLLDFELELGTDEEDKQSKTENGWSGNSEEAPGEVGGSGTLEKGDVKGRPDATLGALIFANDALKRMVGPERSTTLQGKGLLDIFEAWTPDTKPATYPTPRPPSSTRPDPLPARQA